MAALPDPTATLKGADRELFDHMASARAHAEPDASRAALEAVDAVVARRSIPAEVQRRSDSPHGHLRCRRRSGNCGTRLDAAMGCSSRLGKWSLPFRPRAASLAEQPNDTPMVSSDCIVLRLTVEAIRGCCAPRDPSRKTLRMTKVAFRSLACRVE